MPGVANDKRTGNGTHLDQDRGLLTDGLPPGAPLVHHQLFLVIDTVGPRWLALSAQEYGKARIAKPATLIGQMAQALEQLRLRWSCGPYAAASSDPPKILQARRSDSPT